MYLPKKIHELIDTDPNFVDETQGEFNTRIIEVEKRFTQLDAQLPLEDRIIRLKRANTVFSYSNQALEEIPDLIDFIEAEYPINKELEERLKTL